MSLKFVQLLQVCEHLVVPLAQVLEHFARKFEVKAITAEIVRCLWCTPIGRYTDVRTYLVY